MRTVIFLFALLSVILPAIGAGGSSLDLIEQAVAAYSDEHVARYLAEVEEKGVQEHGFPRLVANMGVLVANGRMSERRELFRRMMTVACRDAAKGKMPKSSGGNEFSVKELALALGELEQAKVFPADVTDAWRADLSRIEAKRCYSVIPRPGDTTRAYNWYVFGAASEQVRIAKGLGGDSAFVEACVRDQLRWFDENGMYRDPHEPAVYDFVTRLQFAVILKFGYDGASKDRLVAMMERSAEPTLRMLSACGEIPYGGRSNQFLHNHTCYAALCAWYAGHFAAKGDLALARRFASAEQEALDALSTWLAVRPVRHVKNAYPPDSGLGCESYAYFDKYMVTMGSWAILERAFAADVPAEKARTVPDVFVTSPHFHWVFMRAGEYSVQFDSAANPQYDCDGLGRIHRRGAPPQLALSTPCARTPNYRIAQPNDMALAILPVAEGKLNLVKQAVTDEAAETEWTVGEQTWRCRLSEAGLEMTLSGAKDLALTLPVFVTDGLSEAVIEGSPHAVSSTCFGWRCTYRTNGEIVRTEQTARNRNGTYRRYEARGHDTLKVTVTIERVKEN